MTSTTATSSPRRRLLKRSLLTLEVLLFLALVAILAAALALRHAMQTSLPQLDGTLPVAGLTAPVTVSRDDHGVPSIHAANLDDLLFAQGYITAADRLFQMDALRRHASGTLAELLGPGLVDHDKRQRYLQMREAADRAVLVLPPDQLHQLQAYARGVNAYIAPHTAAHTLPVEFHLLHYTPAPWTPRDSLLIALVMSEDLATRFPEKLNRESLVAHLPAATRDQLTADLYPVGSWRDHPPGQPVTDLTAPGDVEEIPLDKTQSRLNQHHSGCPTSGSSDVGSQDACATPHDLLALTTALETCEDCRAGSNNWVVAGARSATGAPLLSNDMHLSLSVPDIWYEAALHTADHTLDVTGFTLPGVPFVIVGRNAHVAWGFTNSGADVQDLYVEHLRGSGASTEFQQPDGTWALATHQSETIHVRAGHDVSLDVLLTRHALGASSIPTPLISPLYPTERRALALAWTVYDPTTVTSPLYAVNTAPDAASLVAAFAGFGSVSQNLVYADAQHIGYHLIGRVPIRGPATAHPRPVAAFVLPNRNPDDEDDDDSTLTPSTTSRPKAAGHGGENPVSKAGSQAAVIPQLPTDATFGNPIPNVPIDALNSDAVWSGYIPYDQLPSVQDPAEGVLATANARITPDLYPYFITDDWVDPYRVERIRKLLGTRTGLTPADMLAIQTDTHSELDLAVAQRVAYAIDESLAHNPPAAVQHDARRLHQAADLLRAWHGTLTADSAAASIAYATRTTLWPVLLSAQLTAANPALSQQQLEALTSLYTWGEKTTALEQLLNHMPARWLPAGTANWNDVLTLATERALHENHAPRDLSTWGFGKYRPIEIAHPIFDSTGLMSLLLGTRTGTGWQPTAGDNTTVRQLGPHFGPSERFTADLANPADTHANLTTGQSGNPASPYYLDQFQAWLQGTTFTQPLNPTTTTHTLTLTPNH
jgi:penicillin amidase